MELSEILRRLNEVAKKKKGIIRDGMRVSMFRLFLFPDGSGEVQADWSKYDKEMCREEKILHEIFSVDGPIFEFNNVGELEAWLKEQSGV
jgi:hypothetical protein